MRRSVLRAFFFLPYLGGQGWVLQSWRSCGGRRELTHSLWSAASLVCLFRQMTTASCTPGIGQWKELDEQRPHERWSRVHSYMLVVSFLLRGMQTHAVLVTHPLFTYYHIHTHMERRKLQADTNNEASQTLDSSITASSGCIQWGRMNMRAVRQLPKPLDCG